MGIRCLVGGINLIKKIMIGILEQSCHRLAFAAEVVAALNEERIRETKVNSVFLNLYLLLLLFTLVSRILS